SRSRTDRPSSSSRTVPPTTHASCPARISTAVSTIDHDPARPVRGGADAARELVGDRARVARMLLGEDAVADQRDLRAGLEWAVELDGDRIHRDRADDAAPLARHEHRR